MVAQRSLGAKSVFFTANSADFGRQRRARRHLPRASDSNPDGHRRRIAGARSLDQAAFGQSRSFRPHSAGSRSAEMEAEARLKREVTFVTAERAASPAEAVGIADAIGYPVVLEGHGSKRRAQD